MKNNKKGFTIVELVIVIAVIAILAAVLIPTFSNVIGKAKGSSAIQAGKSKFEELYALDYADGTIDGKYTDDAGTSQTVTSGTKITTGDFANCTYTFASGKVTKFEYTDGSYTATYNGTDWSAKKN